MRQILRSRPRRAGPRHPDSKSQYVDPFLGKRSWGALHFSTTIAVTTKNSTDLDMGRRPELKSVEFLVVTAMVDEKISFLVEIARR